MNENNSANKTKVVAIFLVLFIIAAVFGILYSRSLNQKPLSPSEITPSKVSMSDSDSLPSEVPTNEPTLAIGSTNLSFLQIDPSLKIGSPFKVSVNTTGTPIVSADFVIKYDPAVLEFVSADKGSIFDLVLKTTHDATKGEVKFSTSITAEASTKDQTGEAMIATFKPLKAGMTQISLDPLQTIAALKGQNILNKQSLKALSLEISQ